MGHPDVVVVGAGVAGLGAAALLAAEHRRRVEVFERAPFVGGRAVSFVGRGSHLIVDGLTLDAPGFRKALATAGTFVARAEPDLDRMLEQRLLDGYTIEAGGHGLFWGNRSRVAHLLARLGEKVDLPVNTGLGFVDRTGGMHQVEGGRAYPWMSPAGYASTREVLRDMASVTPVDLARLMHTSLAAWLDERHLHPEAYEYVKVLAASQTGMADPAMTPAGDFLGYMMAARPIGMNLVTGSVATVPEPGPIAIPLAFERVLTAHGGTVHRASGVRRVIVEGGRATGVELFDGSTVTAPTVIVTLPPKHAAKVLPTGAPAGEWWGAGFLTGLYAVGEDVWVGRGIDERSFVFVPDVLSEGYVGAVDLVLATLGSWGRRTPQGRRDFCFSTALIDREMRTPELVGRVVDWCDAWFRRTFPGVTADFVLWTAAPEAYGTWRRVGEERPDVTSAIGGLFFAGDQYGRRLWGGGIDAAALSAVLCVDAITGGNLEGEIFPWYHRGLPEA